MINKVFCSVGEENGLKYLKIEKNHSEPALNKWNLVFDSIKNRIIEEWYYIMEEEVMMIKDKLIDGKELLVDFLLH